jgi:mannose/cellobiose epimerase-like protein (N-acyl-D-glucosamine 2-epimerase family)
VAKLTGGRKEGTTIRNKILSVLTLAQLARRTVMEPNFPEEGNCVMHLSNANLTAYDLPGLLHVASWSLDKVGLQC